MLLTRDQFRQSVFDRDSKNRVSPSCVICGVGRVNVSAHHIIERRLFPDGGYFINNGATLCDECHLKAEMTLCSVESIRTACGINNPVLPPGFDPALSYDKWGNVVLSDGRRLKGPLFHEESVQKVLREANLLERFENTRDIMKYPRTSHIRGSKFQNGDDDMESVAFETISGSHLVIEEKVDGANSGISFVGGKLHLQSRGHYLIGGPREAHFSVFKAWANTFASVLYDVLGDRYIMYGEWMYAKHTVFYDRLPHLFMEFDIYDVENGEFLSTPRRHEMLDYLRLYIQMTSVPVLGEGEFENLDTVTKMIRPSLFKSPEWRNYLKRSAEESGVSWEDVQKQTNMSDLSEGLYIKEESNGQVVGRYKFVRSDFLNSILDSETHWMDRPIVPNLLAQDVDLYKVPS